MVILKSRSTLAVRVTESSPSNHCCSSVGILHKNKFNIYNQNAILEYIIKTTPTTRENKAMTFRPPKREPCSRSPDGNGNRLPTGVRRSLDFRMKYYMYPSIFIIITIKTLSDQRPMCPFNKRQSVQGKLSRWSKFLRRKIRHTPELQLYSYKRELCRSLRNFTGKKKKNLSWYRV